MTKKNNNNSRGSKGTPNLKSSGNSVTSRTREYGAGGSKQVYQGRGYRKITPTSMGVRVRFQESTTFLISETAASVRGYELIGGIFSSTTWLLGIAQNYAKFKIHNIKVSYASICPTTQTGEVVLAWVPDANDASAWTSVGTSPTTIFNFSKWVAGPCYGGSHAGLDGNSMQFTVSSKEIHNSLPWFIVGSGSELLMHYGGAIIYQLGQNGSGSQKSCGRIFIDYDIEFCQPNSSTELALMRRSSQLTIPEQGRRTVPDLESPTVPKPPSSPSLPRVPRSLDLTNM